MRSAEARNSGRLQTVLIAGETYTGRASLSRLHISDGESPGRAPIDVRHAKLCGDRGCHQRLAGTLHQTGVAVQSRDDPADEFGAFTVR
jgi:hypothetical protein